MRGIGRAIVTIACAALAAAAWGQAGDAKPAGARTMIDVTAFGVRADGKTDDTAALQKALDEAGKTGSEVKLPAGQYRVSGSLRVPVGVAVVGVHQAPVYIEPLVGTVVLATGGRGKEEGPALFELGDSASVQGITVFYPEQKVTDIVPYPYTFHLVGGDNTVENCTLINSYQGIRIGPEGNVRHRIRSVYGCVLRRGIWLDACTDIGRIENVQWHCHWWSSAKVGGAWEPVHTYMKNHLEAFVFGRTDWEYVTNCFVFPVNIGYHFIATKNGAMNGQLVGIGSDESQRCIVVDAIQPMGLLITNGQFVAMHGDNPIAIEIAPSSNGSVRLVNCAFWGPSAQCVVNHGKGFLSMNDCYVSSGTGKYPGRALVEADAGRVQVRGCSFGTKEPSIHLKKGTVHAIVAENNGADGVRIVNEIGDQAVLANNEPAK
jgi:hypothetical protein